MKLEILLPPGTLASTLQNSTYRIAVPGEKEEVVAFLDNARPVAATDHRLIGLMPGDLPLVRAGTLIVNLNDVDLEGK